MALGYSFGTLELNNQRHSLLAICEGRGISDAGVIECSGSNTKI